MVANNPALVEARLRALVRSSTGLELDEIDRKLGAGVSDDRGFFFVDDDPRAVGRALRWAEGRALTAVDLLAASGAGDLARRASLVAGDDSRPLLTVWAVAGADVTVAGVEPVETPPGLPAEHWALAGVMTEAGARPVDDHGVLVAEVAGLEVGRVVEGADGLTIDIGVGQADRELNQLVHRETDPGAALRRVIAAVGEYRTGSVHHPLTRVARERWLRSILLDDPGLVGATELEPLVPLRPRRGLLPVEPSAAAGRLVSGRPVVVVTMVGIDLDLVPEAADYRNRWNPEADIVLAMPERDLRLSTSLLSRVQRAGTVALVGPWDRGELP